MQVGNDIVDLNYVQNHNPRFAERVLADEELQKFEAGAKSPAFLWQAWAAKESAFKIIKQRGKNEPFSPSKFVWQPEKGQVCYGDETIPVRTEVADHYVYCFSEVNGKRPISVIDKVASLLRDNPIVTESAKLDGVEGASLAVRVLARRIISEQLALHPLDIYFNKNEQGAPEAYYKAQKLPLAISFSHHGDYAAVAISGSYFTPD